MKAAKKYAMREEDPESINVLTILGRRKILGFSNVEHVEVLRYF